MFKVNSNYARLPGSYLFADIAARVKAYSEAHPEKTILKLGIGDVTRPLAPAVVSAFQKAVLEMGVAETFHGYGPDYGYDFLREAIRQHDYAAHGVDVAMDEIFVSDGAKCDVSNVQELFSPDTVIAVTDPVYPVYVDSNAMAGRAGTYENGRWNRLIYLPCNAENGFEPALPTQRPDVIYLCYPNNPTGTVLTAPQLKRWVDYAREQEALIIYDAAYKEFITSGAPHSIYEIEGAKDVAIECCSFSKTAGFTGTRCGWMVIPKGVTGLTEDGSRLSLNAMWKRRMATKFNGVSYPVQRGAAAVYSPEGQREIKAVIAGYMENARIIRESLIAQGFTVFGGQDAPYIWLKTPDGLSGWEFFDLLLKKCNIVGTPGEGFGPSGAGYFRLTAFNTLELTRKAMERISRIND